MQPSLLSRTESSRSWFLVKVLFVLGLILTTACVVYVTGGTGHSFTHFMYTPIILSAFYFDVPGAVLVALLAGLTLGPFMPQDVASGLMQPTASWIFRVFTFVMIGITSALLFKRIKDYKKDEIENSYINFMTGFPNIGKLQIDLEELIDKKTEFSLIGFRIENINGIKQNISYEIGIRALIKSMELLSQLSSSTVYSIYADEFAVILPGNRIENAKKLGKEFLSKTLEPFLIDQFRIGLLIKGGIVNFPQEAKDSNEMIKKMGMVLDQTNGEIGLYVYNEDMEQSSKRQAELVPHLLQAIQNEEFSLVYQPKGSLSGDSIMSVEALLRWNHPTRGQISPGEFINIAEEVGLIGEITKWVIKNVIIQKAEWKKVGMPVKIAFNISPMDLNNRSVMNYLAEVMENKSVHKSLLEIELTERGILENREIIIPLFNNLRKQGIKIALDDFGTGHNSLVNVLQFPMDCLKIDKTFIDNINDHTYKLVIKSIINVAHDMGGKVIAEGVERKEQLDILKELGCDYIQGYYLSKPLPPDELIEFYKSGFVL